MNDILKRPICKPTNPVFAWALRERPRQAVRMAGVPAEVRNFSDSVVSSHYTDRRKCFIRSFISVKTLRDMAHDLELFLLYEYTFSDCWLSITLKQ
jgi:hypothetical protein